MAPAACLLGVWRSDEGAVGGRGTTATFVAGILTVLLVAATQVMGYGMMLFSIHMLQKMILTVLLAVLLMLGAPVSLAVRVV